MGIALSLFIAVSVSTSLSFSTAHAVSVLPQCSDSQVMQATGNTNVCNAKKDNASTIIKDVVNTLLFIIGVLSVVMLIVGGIRYAASAGNSSSVTAAKNTIIYALVGLVVAVLAGVIVNAVMNAVYSGKIN